mgnify:CR=1 FL=1
MILPEGKTVLPNACLRRGFRLRQGSGGQVGRQAGFVIEGCFDPPSLRDGETSPHDPLRLSACDHAQAAGEGPLGDHTGRRKREV